MLFGSCSLSSYPSLLSFMLVASVSVLCYQVMACVPALLLLSLSTSFGAFFLSASTSDLLVLFSVFLLIHLAALFGSQFLRDGVALWAESVALVGFFALFSGSFLDLCPLISCALSFSIRFSSSSFLAFCEFLLFLSCVLYFALWLLLRVCDVVHCPPLWGSSSAFVYLALLLVA